MHSKDFLEDRILDDVKALGFLQPVSGKGPWYTNSLVLKIQEVNRNHIDGVYKPVEVSEPEPKIRVFDGTRVNPFDLKPSDMKPMVMIHLISTQNRFTGHAAYPYSIGQHSRNLAMLVPAHLKRAALIRDFSEAFFNDLTAPVKRVSPAYKEAEHEATIRIFNHFGVTSAEYTELGQWDKAIYVNERDALFAGKIGERGQGDQYTALDTSRIPLAFNETDWRGIRDGLILLWLALFPDFDLFTGEKRD